MNKQSTDRWDVGNFYLANGKALSKENIDIHVLMNLSNVQRAFSFAGVPPSVNLNLTSHSYLTMLIAYRFLSVYPEFREVVNPDKIAAFAMLHDIAEALLGDIPTPLKHPAFAQFEDQVRDSIFEYLGVDSAEMRRCYDLIQFADLVASVYECDYATSKGYDLSLIGKGRIEKIYSLFSFSNRLSNGVDDNSMKWFAKDHGYGYCECEDGTLKFVFSNDMIVDFIEEVTGAVLSHH